MEYSVMETSPGIWRIQVGFYGPVKLIDLEGGPLPEGKFTPFPQFTSKEQAEGFVQGLEAGINVG